MTTLYPNTYSIDEVDNWQDHLAKEGYVVIKDILNEKEHTDYFEQFKRDWAFVSPEFDFKDTTTWGIEHTPIMYGKGMAVFNGFGQSDFMWKIRTNENIQTIFKKIHRTDELVTSLDGFSVFVSNKQKSKSWLHIDQNPCNSIYSIQGSYNFIEVGKEDAGFLIVPKSHINFKPAVSHKKDWIMVAEKEIVENAVKLLIPKNCITLWNSKLIHSNIGMTKNNKNTELNRVTPYITYLPRHVQSKNIRDLRIQAYLLGNTTSHWANKCEIKRYPWGFGKRYEERGYKKIIPKLMVDNSIPIDRLKLL